MALTSFRINTFPKCGAWGLMFKEAYAGYDGLPNPWRHTPQMSPKQGTIQNQYLGTDFGRDKSNFVLGGLAGTRPP